MNELTKLRVSVARIAQALGVDNELRVTGKAYSELLEIAAANERGWNNLCARCVERAGDLKTTMGAF